MRPPIPPKQPRIPHRHRLRHDKLQPRMRPPRRARKRPALRPSRSPHRNHRSLHELSRSGDQCTRASDLAHVTRDEVRLHELDRHAVGREFRPQCRGPLLQEGFAAAVGGQQGRGYQPAKGAHCEDQAALSLHHPLGYDAGDFQRRAAVDFDDAVNFLDWRLQKGDRDAVAQSHVVDQDGDVHAGTVVVVTAVHEGL